MSSVLHQQKARPVTPLGILVEHLANAIEMIEADGNVSEPIASHVKQAWRLAAGIDPYLSECTTQESKALAALAKRTQEEAWSKQFAEGTTVRPLEQEMLSGHLEGQTLKMFVYMSGAQQVLDIGMFTGYSALAMAEALPLHGRLVACEVDSYTANLAQSLFEESPHKGKIQVEVGSALETLDKLAAAEESFDLVFIDADKKEYVQYFQTLLDQNLLAPHGIICVDNTLLQGLVYLPPQERTPNAEAIAQFNRIVADDPRVEQVLLPLRDGLTIIRRL